MMKTRHDNDVTDHTSSLYVENETELLWSYGVRFMMKTRQDNEVIDRIGAVYTDIRTELSWQIR